MTDPFPVALQRLDEFAAIAVTGGDAKTYLQGQLTFDLDQLTTTRAALAACNSAQGRVQAVFWLIERSDAIVLILPATMVATTLARLRKYVLRAKAKFETNDRFAVFAASGAVPEAVPFQHTQTGDRSFIGWPGARTLCIAPADTAAGDAEVTAAWHRADIAAGLPQIYPPTHEAFVAQMLNLDLLGGISFEKGCYTGQEIIARTHFRGAIKRRMFRFKAAASAPEPGTRIVQGEQHAGDVVDAVATPTGCELLAVVNLAQIDQPLSLGSASGTALERLPLPYPV